MSVLFPTRAAGRKLLAIAAAWLGLTLAVPALADGTGSLPFGNQTRTYSIHVPDGPPPRGGFPVILAFHGGGMQGAGMQRLTHLDEVADRDRFIAVYPDGIDRHWNDGRATIKNPQDDVGFVSALIDQLEQRYPVDAGRIYATGISNGALFAERLGCDLSRRIAAIAPVAGTLPADIAPACRPARELAVMQIDGTADLIMPYGGGAVADFGGKGEGGQVLSVAETAAIWARANGCGRPGVAQPLAPVAPLDRTRIARMAYSACRPAGQVVVFTVEGGGHAWPGGPQYARPRVIGWASRQMDASSTIAAFFLSLPRR